MSIKSSSLNVEQHQTSLVKRGLSRAGIVAAYTVGPAEVVTTDVLFAKFGNYADRVSENLTTNPVLHQLLGKGALSAVVYTESVLIGLAILKNKRLRGAYAGFERYQNDRQSQMSKPRKLLSSVINAPYRGLEMLGKKIEKSGSGLADSEDETIRKAGRLIVDIGKTNSMGTTGTVLTELGEPDSPVDNKRVKRLSGIFAATWLPTFVGVQQAYRGLPHLGPVGRVAQTVVGAAGHGIDVATTVNLLNPMETPVGTVAMSALVGALAVTGWRVANYLEQQNQSLTPARAHKL